MVIPAARQSAGTLLGCKWRAIYPQACFTLPKFTCYILSFNQLYP
jgi:hypothetical protein